MKFSDTDYGDLTGLIYGGKIALANANLTSLEGAPDVVDGDLILGGESLEDLEFAPKEVTGDFHCTSDKLKSTKGLPSKIGGSIAIWMTEISSLEDFPDICHGTLTLSINKKLASLKGCSKTILGDFYVQGTAMDSKEKLFKEIIDNKINVKGKIHASFAGINKVLEFTMEDVKKYSKMGKFRDLLKFKEV